ncbi:MAG: hypothetical protein KDE27_31090 [Planctomycetes bacterium]|nr:hypothetical protein [Planctomycetota bacterium]
MSDRSEPTSESSRSRSAPIEQMLARAIPDAPLDEDRILATLERGRRQLANRGRRAVGVAGLLLLAAGGFWRWSGENSRELIFAQAIDIGSGRGGYSHDNVQAVTGKIKKDLKTLLAGLRHRAALTPSMMQAMLQAFDAPVALPITYVDGFEEVLLKLETNQTIDADDEAIAIEAVRAGATVLRQIHDQDPSMQRITALQLSRLRDVVANGGPAGTATPTESDPDRIDR